MFLISNNSLSISVKGAIQLHKGYKRETPIKKVKKMLKIHASLIH